MYNWSTLKKLIWLYAAKIRGGAQAIIETITGNLPLVLQNAISHAIVSLTRYGLCTQDGTPTPDAPVDIMCNNGALKYGWQDVITTSQLSGYGTYVSPAQAAGNRAYRWFKDLPNGTYQISVDGDYELIVQWRDPADPSNIIPSAYENLSGWMTSGEVTLDKESGGYGIAVRRTSGTDSITPSNFDGTLHVQERGLYIDGTPETLTVRGINLFNSASPLNTHAPIGFGGNSTMWPNAAPTAYPNSITYFMRVKPSTTYTYSCATAGDRFGVAGVNSVVDPSIYTTDHNLVFDSVLVSLKSSNIATTYTFTTDADTKMVAVYCALNTAPTKIQIEEGATATAYVEHTEQTVTDIPMLLSVGGIKDEVEIISGGVTRKVGIKVFDGTETVNVSSAGNAYIAIDGVAIGAPNTPIDTHFALETSTTSLAEGRARFGAKGQTIYSSNYYMSHPTARTAADFKAWLASEYANGTPVIVLYPLATETTEHTTAQNLNTVEGTNIVDSVANVSPLEAEVKYYATQPPSLGVINPNAWQDDPEDPEA